ncbi:MAG: thiamine-phosphate kinase [Myxococcota bacterium]
MTKTKFDEIEPTGEERLIARYFQPIATHPGAMALSDDAAYLTPPPGCDIVLKTDAIVGGIHFRPNDPPGDVARKALRVNLSDLAAKGARPLGFLLSLALPRDVESGWLAGFAEGLRADAEAFGCPLFGGDTDGTPGPVMISVAMIGSLPTGTMVHRAGASPGDRIFVSGTIGDAALGLALASGRGEHWPIDAAARAFLRSRHHLPRPRTALAEAIRAHASASIDVSDGLIGDVAKLCRVARVAARVEIEAVPISDAARAVLASESGVLESLLVGGEDFEIVCTVPPDRGAAFEAAARTAGVPVREIGRIEAGSGVRFVKRDGEALAVREASFSHF